MKKKILKLVLGTLVMCFFSASAFLPVYAGKKGSDPHDNLPSNKRIPLGYAGLYCDYKTLAAGLTDYQKAFAGIFCWARVLQFLIGEAPLDGIRSLKDIHNNVSRYLGYADNNHAECASRIERMITPVRDYARSVCDGASAERTVIYVNGGDVSFEDDSCKSRPEIAGSPRVNTCDIYSLAFGKIGVEGDIDKDISQQYLSELREPKSVFLGSSKDLLENIRSNMCAALCVLSNFTDGLYWDINDFSDYLGVERYEDLFGA